MACHRGWFFDKVLFAVSLLTKILVQYIFVFMKIALVASVTEKLYTFEKSAKIFAEAKVLKNDRY